MMEGRINVESEYGKGSTFTITVKQKPVECGVIGPELSHRLRNFTYAEEKQATKMQIVRTPMPYGKVLVVDDVETNLYVAEGLMAPYKLNIETANNGMQAIQKIEAGNSYDIVFMDHMMPVMDGIEATEKLRGMGYKGVIVALTANALAGNDEMFKSHGFDDFVSKPIDVRSLNAALNRYIRDTHPAERAAAEAAAEAASSQAPAPQNAAASTASAPAETLLSFLKKIEGLDAQKALDTMGGLTEVYEKTVRMYARLTPESIEKMNGELSPTGGAPDLKAYAVDIHGMKGSCRNIGAFELGDIAYKLEMAAKSGDEAFCKANYPGFREQLAAFHKKVADTIAEFDKKAAPGKQTGDKQFLRGNLEKAIAAADGFDANEANNFMKKIAEFTYGAEIDILIDDIIKPLDAFDCDTAMSLMNKLKEKA
jgi:CheY-like chemotaxis protein/HPt (histidine-containing phosphotransfer) domain-containing protein